MPVPRFVYDPWELPPEQRHSTFVGRGQILDRLLAAIREQEDRTTIQHYILTGPRGIGKTTLLLTLRDRIRQDLGTSTKWFCIQLREEEYYVHKQRDLWELVLRALAAEEKLFEAQKVVEQAQAARDDEKSSALLVDGLREICTRHGKRLLLLIDNFDQIFPNTAAGRGKHRRADSEYRAFRKRLSTERFLMLITTSVKVFQDIYGYDKGFFNFFSSVELPELSQEEVAEMLRLLGQADENGEFLSRLKRSAVNIRTLSFLTGGNPRLVTMLYHILAQREFAEPIQALWETVAGLTPMLRQELAEMPRQQSKTLDALLRLNGVASPAEISKYSRLPLNVITTQLGRLREARYVALEGGGKGRVAIYRVADQMFAVWYWMRYVSVARRRIELFVEFLRAWFSEEERRRLFLERWDRFHRYQSCGSVGMATQALRDAEYYAASLESLTERKREMERIADAYITSDDWSSAAGLFAELAGGTQLKSRAKFQSLGYSVLAARLMEKGDLEGALKGFSEAIAKNPQDWRVQLAFGACLLLKGNDAEAIERFDRTLAHSRLRPEVRSMALVGRGVARFRRGDRQGALADFSAAAELKSAPKFVVAEALVYRGLIRSLLDDLQGAMADFMAVAEIKGLPAAQQAKALMARGTAKGQMGDLQGAEEDFTAAVELKGAPKGMVAAALTARGFAKHQLGDLQGEMADYTAAVELKGAPPEALGWALVNRGEAKEKAGDLKGALADYTAAVDLRGAPPNRVAGARIHRGGARAQLGELDAAVADLTAAVELKGAPAEEVARGLALRGGAYESLGRHEEALADYSQCAESRTTPFVQDGLAAIIRLLLSIKRVDGAIAWVRRFGELDPPEAPLNDRLSARLEMIREASSVTSLEDVGRLVDALLKSDPEELRARLQFVKPGLELARTNDESVLAKLPEDERKMAREIAQVLKKAAHQRTAPSTP